MGDREPDLQLKVWLVPYGIQANVYKDGVLLHEMCRDFRVDHPLDKLKAQMLSFIYTAINLFIQEQNK